ncbi:hypothetical protein ACHAXT_003308 [Thalassiosira profunda]
MGDYDEKKFDSNGFAIGGVDEGADEENGASDQKPLLAKEANGNGGYGTVDPKTHRRNPSLKSQRSKSFGDFPASPLAARTAAARAKREATLANLSSSWVIGDHALDILAPRDQTAKKQTIVLAPDDVDLPPNTPLLGSSKLVAQARSEDLKRRSIMKARRTSKEDITTIDEETSGEEGSELDDSGRHLRTMSGTIGNAHTLKEIEAEYRDKVRTTFINDAMTFAEGTIPQSIIVATVIGIVCGVVAFLYYSVLDYFLELIWKVLPEMFVVDRWPENLYVLWIPLVTFTLSACCGLSIYYLGEPGDLAYTIKCVHEKGYKGTSHILPMVAASQFTILAGGSLGPEAPLVAICAATAGFISRRVFKQRNRNVVRKHTFMGMSGALSAFFGVPLGGSLFALEVTSRFGIEYFEHLIEAIFAGEVCVVVFRGLAGLPLEHIWEIVTPRPSIHEAQPYQILLGGGIGLLGAGLAYIWANFHWRLMDGFRKLGLLDDENIFAVRRCLVGAVGVALIGMLIPQTMFWGEYEIQAIATLSPASKLAHVWPTSGLIGFEMDSCWNCLAVGFAKLMAISFTVCGGYRGGYIFPFFAAGAAFGRAFSFVFPQFSPIITTLCFAAGINVAITRTALATSLILAFLAGEQMALPAILSASVCSLFATGYMPFIKSQLARSDIDFSLFYRGQGFPRLSETIPHGEEDGKDKDLEVIEED